MNDTPFDLGMEELDPTILAALDDEEKFLKPRRQNRMPEIKLDREEGVLYRFMPVEIGTNKSWFTRFGLHWVNGKPITCRRVLSKFVGGDENYDCPVCAELENLLASTSGDAHKRALKCQAEPLWYAVAITLAREAAKSSPVTVPEPKCWVPHGVRMYSGQFQALKEIYGRTAVRTPKNGDSGGELKIFTDFYEGINIWWRRGARGYEVKDLAKRTPLVKDPSRMQEVVDTIWSQIVIPDFELADRKTEEEFAFKVRDFVINGDPREAGNRRGAQDYDDDLPPVEQRPAPRQAAPAAAAAPTAPAPRRAESKTAPAVRPPPAPTAPAPTAPAPTPPARPAAVAPTAAPAVRPPTAAAPAAPAVRPPAAAPAAKTAPIAKPAAPRAAQAPLPVPATSAATEEDEHEGVAPERLDHAPPIDGDLDGQAPTDSPFTAEPPPPEVTAAVGARLGTSLRDRLKNASEPKQ